MIVTGGNHPGEFLELLHDGSDFGLDHLYYTYQSAPQGIADAIGRVSHFIGDERFVVILGDNILNGSIRPYVENFTQMDSGGRVLLREVDDPERFGVPRFDEDDNIVELIEKPPDPPSPYAVIGVYMYDSRFWEILPTLELSDRGQYEITDVNAGYLQAGELEYDILPFEWTDAGTPASLHRASILARNSDFLRELPVQPPD
jgi:glucose-1-phosphate thymidylyltransferase